MNTSGETAELVVKEGIQITESAVKLAGLGAKNLGALLIAIAKDTGCAIVIIAHIKQSQTAKKPLERIIKDVCRHEVLGDFRTGKS